MSEYNCRLFVWIIIGSLQLLPVTLVPQYVRHLLFCCISSSCQVESGFNMHLPVIVLRTLACQQLLSTYIAAIESTQLTPPKSDSTDRFLFVTLPCFLTFPFTVIISTFDSHAGRLPLSPPLCRNHIVVPLCCLIKSEDLALQIPLCMSAFSPLVWICSRTDRIAAKPCGCAGKICKYHHPLYLFSHQMLRNLKFTSGRVYGFLCSWVASCAQLLSEIKCCLGLPPIDGPQRLCNDETCCVGSLLFLLTVIITGWLSSH